MIRTTLFLITTAAIVWSGQIQQKCYLNSEYLQKLEQSKSPIWAYSNTTRANTPDLGIVKDLVFISHLSTNGLNNSNINAWMNFQYDFTAAIKCDSFHANDDKSYNVKFARDSLLRIGSSSFSEIGSKKLCEKENLEKWAAKRIFDGTKYANRSNQKIESKNGAIIGAINLQKIFVNIDPKPGQDFDLLCGSDTSGITCYAFTMTSDSLNIYSTNLENGWFERKGLLFSGKTSDSTARTRTPAK